MGSMNSCVVSPDIPYEVIVYNTEHGHELMDTLLIIKDKISEDHQVYKPNVEKFALIFLSLVITTTQV